MVVFWLIMYDALLSSLVLVGNVSDGLNIARQCPFTSPPILLSGISEQCSLTIVDFCHYNI